MTLDVERAKAVILTAKEYGMYEGPLPEADEKILSEAQLVTDIAENAKTAGVRGDAVMAVLFAAQVDGGSPSNPHYDEEAAKLPEEPYEGYNDLTQAEIIEILSELPEQEGEAFANEVLEQVKEYEKATKARKGILNFRFKKQGVDNVPDSEEEGEGEEAVEEEPQAEEEGSPTAEPVKNGESEEESKTAQIADLEYEQTLASAAATVGSHGFPVPQDDHLEDGPTLPFDLTQVSDIEVRRLHSQYNALSARAGYLLMLEDSYATACKNIADKKAQTLLTKLDRIDPHTAKPKTMTILEAEIAQDDEWTLWNDRRHSHQIKVDALRRWRDMFDKNCAILSREWTMRAEERDHSGGLRGRR